MAISEDHIVLAAEYALGTLEADERAQVETMMMVDREFAALVRAWEFRLGALNQMVGSVEPRPIVWENIKSAIGHSVSEAPHPAPEAPIVLSESPPTLPQPEPELLRQPARDVPAAMPAVEDSNVIQLSREAGRWRNVARVASALAAALIAMLGVEIFLPGSLPDVLRPKPRVQVVEVKTPAPKPVASAQYVAILQAQGGGPAFILTVDGATRHFTIRKVGAPAVEAGKSYELWLISDKLPQPRSLGVIGTGDFTARRVLGSYAVDVVDNATYAVTVEQAGGSPDGAPHSTPVFTGKLIETVPSATPAQNR